MPGTPSNDILTDLVIAEGHAIENIDQPWFFDWLRARGLTTEEKIAANHKDINRWVTDRKHQR